MLAGFAWLIALLVVWFDIRHPKQPGDPGRKRSAYGRHDALAVTAILLAYLPIGSVLRGWSRFPGYLPGDARTHALAAQHLFGEALRSGWSDVYVGGFPLAVHYPLVGWVLLALPMQLGLDPTRAVHVACTSALVATSVAGYWIGRTHGVRVIPSLIAALVFAWIAPLNAFVGGFESYFVTGLVSQVMVVPFLLGWSATTLGRGTAALASAFASLSFLTHPQVAVAATVLLGIAVLISAERRAIERFVLSAIVSGLVAMLIYGPGVMHLQLPFGWPPNPVWMHVGFGPERLDDWLVDGDLLDNHRAPILTALWLCGFTLCAAKPRVKAARVAAVASIGVLLLSVSGPAIAASGRPGQIALSILQPLRAMALIPTVVAATITVGLALHGHVFEHVIALALTRPWLLRINKQKPILKLGLSVVLGMPLLVSLYQSRVKAIERWLAEMADDQEELPCGPDGPSRADWLRLRDAIGKLENGRLWFEDDELALPARCALTTGFERHSSIPIANTRGIGAHVGFLSAVNGLLMPGLSGLASRAEALGIHYLLLGHALKPQASAGFDLLDTYGPLHLYVRTGGTDLFGAGCVTDRWNGPNADLERSFKSQLDRQMLGEILSPTRFSEIRNDATHVSHESIFDECSPSAAALSSERHSVAWHRVSVDSSTPTDVVLRVTGYPSWQWRVDRRDATPRLVLPGYYAVRVPAGRHTIEVAHRFGTPTLVGFLFAGVGPLIIEIVSRRRRRKATTRH
jgi:hypothetical protein